ncbi:uncharacterized protein LOC106179504 [Lingula anatina]|uniref:Uncharacterized protein LOC106179504 n=1 Tax=Lingula anatina TaxID=7574 RepID=A0A1S3K7Z8_LINAN|nr:uncharacterized protein LOC106179504 [Lingula anatina]|eukprot:XP_013418617.1 uncharacterized protein LOC106179504 [Lingula anatina]
MKFLLAALVLCVAVSWASAKAVDAHERIMRTLMEDEEFKRGFTDTVCSGLETVINSYAADILSVGCSAGLTKEFLCGKVASTIGGWFTLATESACNVLMGQSFMQTAIAALKQTCASGAGALNNVDIC